jgi:hypothetical protein
MSATLFTVNVSSQIQCATLLVVPNNLAPNFRLLKLFVMFVTIQNKVHTVQRLHKNKNRWRQNHKSNKLQAI